MLVNAAASGSVVRTPEGCVYREAVTVKKPLTIKAGTGTQIRGSDVWTGWNRSGAYWVRGTLPALQTGGYCKPDTTLCKRPEQVFLDGKPLQQVAASPGPGQFAVNANRAVVLADNPVGRTVEVTVRKRWISGRAPNVTVEGFTMKHAANEATSGALTNDGHDGWTVRGNDLSWAHGANLKLGGAERLLAEGNDVHHGSWMGISGTGADLTVRNNKIHHNNTEAFDPEWAAGGMKNTRMIRLVAEGNEVYANDRVGFWCDEGCENVTYANNRIHHNTEVGIHYEISDDARIYGNEIWENGWGSDGGTGFGEPGIYVASSRNVEVYDNVVAWNNDGITIVNGDRRQGDGTQYDLVYNVVVRNNSVFAKDYAGTSRRLALSWVKDYAAGNIYNAAANNRGLSNRYFYPTVEGNTLRYKWDTGFTKLSTFNATLGDEGARYLSPSEKDGIAAERGVPAAPAR